METLKPNPPQPFQNPPLRKFLWYLWNHIPLYNSKKLSLQKEFCLLCERRKNLLKHPRTFRAPLHKETKNIQDLHQINGSKWKLHQMWVKVLRRISAERTPPRPPKRKNIFAHGLKYWLSHVRFVEQKTYRGTYPSKGRKTKRFQSEVRK